MAKTTIYRDIRIPKPPLCIECGKREVEETFRVARLNRCLECYTEHMRQVEAANSILSGRKFG
jgi:hypothetical protein